MADTPTPASFSQPSTPPSSAAEQARIRKERREAKIKAGGSARLNKITGLGGGVQRGDYSSYLILRKHTNLQPPDPPPQPTVSSHADPDEVDISEHYYEPASNRLPRRTNIPNQQMGNDQLRQMMLGFDPSATPPLDTNPFAGLPGMEGAPTDDPMMKMLQQMMGGAPGEGADGMPSFPGMPTMPGQAVAADPYAYLWRIIHAVFALSLGLYIAFATPFTGSKLDREASKVGSFAQGSGLSAGSVHFFWIFATAEVVLQTSRFFMEKGQGRQGGILGTVIGFLPEPYKGYVALISRYAKIWTTISGDAMVLVFVLGACAWWRGT
jgi:hypothetical protein